MKQAFNPFLPLDEYIPDGEPHVFGDRVYLYGSHDKEAGYTFCMRDYVVYSAPVNDLTDWRYEGVSYKASQDPQYPNMQYMYAPDVVQGNDNRYYLYYCMGGDYGQGGYTCHISVAVSDKPQGPFEYLGFIRNKDASPMKKYICFDPAAMNDSGTIRIYYGTQYDYEERDDFDSNPRYINEEIEMFGRSKEEILSYRPDSIMGAVMLTLEDDMLTVKEEAKHIIPYKVKGTSFEEHPFFEGSSMRKFGDKYYFIYSSWQNHELCYATSNYPDRDFVFGGTIVSNGDVGLNNRDIKDKLNMTGTTHGSIEKIADDYYVFFHRLTHKSDYSRQACAEKIQIQANGQINQVEISSCGLNGGPLIASGKYPAAICCNLTNGHMPHGSNTVFDFEFPNVTNKNNERFIAEIEDETLIGYKYFHFDKESVNLTIKYRYENTDTHVTFDGPVRIDERAAKDNEEYTKKKFEADDRPCYFEIKTDYNQEPICQINLDTKYDDADWQEASCQLEIIPGDHPIYLIYHGGHKCQLLEFSFSAVLA